MKCHWCQKDIVVVDKNDPSYLECPDTHALITLDPFTAVNNVIDAIAQYIVYYDTSHVRYKLVGDRVNNTTRLSSKTGSKGYKEMLTMKYLLPKLEEDTLQVQHIIDKLKKLVIFS